MANHLQVKLQHKGKENTDAARNKQLRNVEIDKWINTYLKAQGPQEKKGLKKIKPLRVRKREPNNDKNRTCPMCGRQFNSTYLTVSHISKHLYYKAYSCCYCKKNFQSHVSAIKHAVDAHCEEIRPFKCFPTAFIDNWIREFVYGDDRRAWPLFWCKLCDFKNREVSLMLTHFEIQHPGKPFSISNQMPITLRKSALSMDPANDSCFTQPADEQDVQLSETTVGTPASKNHAGSEKSPTVNLLASASAGEARSSQFLEEGTSCKSGVPSELEKAKSSSRSAAEPTIGPEEHSARGGSLECDKSFQSKTALLSKNASDCSDTEVDSSDSANIALKCSICTFSTLNLNDFKDHCKLNHSMRGFRRQRTGSNASQKTLKLYKSDNSSSNSTVVVSNAMVSSKCPFCRHWTSSAAELSIHIKKRHPSGTRRPPKRLSSDEDNDMDTECVSRHKTTSSRKRIYSTSTEEESLCHDREKSSCYTSASERDDDKSVKSEPETSASVDFERWYIIVKNPGGDDVKVALKYYKDLWFVKKIRICLKDCLKV